MLTIVWDVDDVLNDLMYQWFTRAWLTERPECSTEYSGLTSNPPHAVLGMARDEYLASMDAFRKAEAGTSLTPNAEVLEWFMRHGDKFRHIALTARPLETAPEVAAWVMRHFGTWIRCFGVVPSRPAEGVPQYDRSKADFLRWLGKGDVLVDDTPENLRHAEALGLRILPWPQPWNDASLSTTEILEELVRMGTELDQIV